MTSPFSRHHDVDRTERVFQDAIRRWLGDQGMTSQSLHVADVGGGDGTASTRLFEAFPIRFHIQRFDLEEQGDDCIRCDITEPLPDGLDEAFDIVVSQSAFEHFRDPFMAADNCVRLLKPGGLILIHTFFAWRYHPVPRDYFRFTDDALKYMFEARNAVATWRCGYDISRRRWDIRGGHFGDGDVPPIDELGGFRENWEVFYVGTKSVRGRTTP